MSGWVKIPEDWTGDDRVEQLGADAAMLHLSALGHCARYLLDGRLPAAALRKLWPVPDLDAAVERLVNLEFWQASEGGYYLADWRVHILSSDEVEHRREQDRLRQQRKRRHDAGDHSLCDRCSFVRGHGVTPSVTNGVSHGTVTRPEPNRTAPNRPPEGGGSESGAGAPLADAAGPGSREVRPLPLPAHRHTGDCCALPDVHPVHAEAS